MRRLVGPNPHAAERVGVRAWDVVPRTPKDPERLCIGLAYAIDAPGPQGRYGVYRMIGMKAYLATCGSFDLSCDVMNFSRIKLSSS